MQNLAVILGLVIFAVDWLTKTWVSNTPWLRYHTVVDGFFRVHYVLNEGIAFGLLHDFKSPWKVAVLSAMAIVAVLVVLYYIRTTPREQTLMFVALGLLLGGILGNFFDRIVHGHVIDFIELHWRDRFAWPTFNVADMAITSGVLLILYETFFGSASPDNQERKEVVTTE